VYEALVKQYAEQIDVAATARARLTARPAGAPGHDDAITLVKVFDGPDAGMYGAMSRDGRYLSYMDSATGDLGIRDLTTGQQRRVTAHQDKSGEFAEYSVFSRDSRRLAYGWQNTNNKYELRTISREGGETKVLYSNGNWLEPEDWSPDGRDVLAVIVRDDHTRQLVFVSATDGSVRVLKTLDWNMGVPDRAEYSPDGRFVAYDRSVTEEAGRGRDVFVIAVDGSREVPIATGPSKEALLGWFPDGSSILVSSDRAGGVGAWSVAVRDGQPQGELRLIKPDIGSVVAYNFTAAGDFVYDLRVGAPDEWVALMDPRTGLGTDKPAPLPQRPLSRQGASWSPDSERVAYRMTPMNVGVQDVKSGALRTIPLKLSYAEAPTWTPDGTGVVLVGADLDARSGIFKVDLVTGSAEMVVETRGAVGPVAMSADGQWLFYRRFEEQPQGPLATVLIARNLKTGQQHDLARRRDPNISGFWLSPDGRWIAIRVSNDQSSSLEIMPATGGASKVLLQNHEPNFRPRGGTWSADGQYVLFVRGSALWRVPVSGGEPEKLNISVPGMADISLSPDGHRLVIGVLDIKEEIWSMRNAAGAARSVR
jgi:Tol biopolymer transport system component